MTLTHACRTLAVRRRALVVSASILLAAVEPLTAERRQSQTAPTDTSTVPIVLPDLSRMHEAVQTQLRDAYRVLEQAESGTTEDGASQNPEDSEPARIQAYGELGKLFLAGDYLDVAEQCFQNAQRLAPDDFPWPYYLAHLVMRQGDLNRAVGYFEQALRLKPADFATLVWLAHAYVELDRTDAAEPILVLAQSLYPNTPAVLYQGGRAALANQEPARAVEMLEAALELNPAATVIHYPLAMAYRALGNLDQAHSHLDQSGSQAGPGEVTGAAVTLPDPLMAEVYAALRSPQSSRDLGLQAVEQGNWPDAVRHFRQAVELAPDNSVLRFNLGAVLNLAGDVRAARTELEEAVRLDPGLAMAHYVLGTILERSGRDNEAIARFAAATTQDPNLSVAHLHLADALRRTGQLERAITSYAPVLDREEARFGTAMALVKLTRYQEATEQLVEAMTRYPEQPAFSIALARLLAAAPVDELRNGARALELAQAVAEENKTAGVAETMAMAFGELGQFDDAVEWQRLAMAVVADAARADVARAMSATLALYHSREPSRIPWRDDEPEHNPGPAVDPELLGPPPPL